MVTDDPILIPDRDCLDMFPLNSILDQLHGDGDGYGDGGNCHWQSTRGGVDGGDGDDIIIKSSTKLQDTGVSYPPPDREVGNGWLHSNIYWMDTWIHVRSFSMCCSDFVFDFEPQSQRSSAIAIAIAIATATERWPCPCP